MQVFIFALNLVLMTPATNPQDNSTQCIQDYTTVEFEENMIFTKF